METIDLQEWQKVGEMHGHALNYMETGEGERKRNCCVEDLLRIERAKGSAMSFTSPIRETFRQRESPPPRTIVNVVPETVTPKVTIPARVEKQAEEQYSTWDHEIRRSSPPTPITEESQEEHKEYNAANRDDNDTGHLSLSSLYSIDDWISENEPSPKTNKLSFFDDLDDPPTHNDSFMHDNSASRRTEAAFRAHFFPQNEAPAEEKGAEQAAQMASRSVPLIIPNPPAVEKPLSLLAYEFAHAVCLTHRQTGNEEFVHSAVDILEQLIGDRLANLETHNLYANLLWAVGRYDDSCEQYETVMELDPANARRTAAMYVQSYMCDDCRRGGEADDWISGPRNKCIDCRDYDLCNDCYPPSSATHDPTHNFLQIPSKKWLRKMGLVCPKLS